MEFRVVFLIISVWRAAMAATIRNQQSEALETTTEFPSYMDEKEKGLTSVPRGGANVHILHLGFNEIANLHRFIFASNGFVELDTIYLRHNRITTINHKAFKNLKLLQNVYMSENNITSLEINTFKTNYKLQKLDLSCNRIRFRNKPFLNSASLETLILSDNRIEQVFEVTFAKLTNLKYLVMNSNVIFSIAERSFIPLKTFQYLSLAHTSVYKLSEDMFQNGSYPRIIDITDTPLARTFNPPLTKVKNKGVIDLISLDKYF